MSVFVEFLQTAMHGISLYLNAFFSITYEGINFGSLFVIGIVVWFVCSLIWG